jgi:hypothetical protein
VTFLLVMILPKSTEFLHIYDLSSFILAVYFPSSAFHQQPLLKHTVYTFFRRTSAKRVISVQVTSSLKYVELCDHHTDFTRYPYAFNFVTFTINICLMSSISHRRVKQKFHLPSICTCRGTGIFQDPHNVNC